MIKEGLGSYSIYWKNITPYHWDWENDQGAEYVRKDVMNLNCDRNSLCMESLMLILWILKSPRGTNLLALKLIMLNSPKDFISKKFIKWIFIFKCGDPFQHDTVCIKNTWILHLTPICLQARNNFGGHSVSFDS